MAYYLASCPADTGTTGLVRVCDARWQIEEGFAQAMGELGLDRYAVRGWLPWHRFVTLCLLAHAYLIVLRLRARTREAAARRGRAATALLPLAVPEVRRMVLALGEPADRRASRLG